MGIVRSGVICSVCVSALACGFDAGGLGSGSGDLEQSTGPSTVTDSSMPSDATDETSGEASDVDTNGEGPSTGSADPTGADGTGGSGCADWWDEQWIRRRPLIIGDRDLEAPLLDFPVLVVLHDARIDYGVMQATGTDLRFVVEAGQVLPHEIEHWDATGLSFVWLRLPMINPTGMEQPRIFMYYGNPAAVGGQSGANVWDAGFVSVHHLGDLRDSTANLHDGVSMTPPMVAEGWAGNGASFNGVEDHVVLPDEAAFDFTTALTVEAWIRVDGFADYYEAIVTKGDDAWRLHRENTTRFVGFGSGYDDNFSGARVVDDGDWHYVAIVYGNTEKRIYVDGMPDGLLAYAGPINATNSVVMFGKNEQQPGREFEGDMDEIRISNVARSRAWIAMQQRSMSDLLLEYGSEQSCP